MKKSILLFISCTIYLTLNAQNNMIGMWEVIEVSMGNNIMTPVAKWTKIHADSTFKSGNGWIQNSTGTWTLDQDIITMTDSLSMEDPYSGFTLSWRGDTMIWQRQEEGLVTVKWRPITQIPMAPLDYFYGNWEMLTPTTNSLFSYPTTLYFRWDRIYRTNPIESASQTGFWQIHGHRNQITFVPHHQEQGFTSYSFSFTHCDTLRLENHQDSLSTIVFFRQRKQ